MFERYFDEVQKMAESGGRQFGPDGKTLVGRYRDGSMPAPSKRAYGVGQVQVGTGRNVAKAHGIEWDEKRFMNDAAYNENIANLHMKDLQAKYQDKTLARAAYHSGEPIVDRAIAKYGREGFARGLGPEGRNYIKMGTPQAKGGASNYLDTLDRSLALKSDVKPETKSSGSVQTNSSATFGSDAELSRRADKVESDYGAQGEALNVLNEVTQIAQGEQLGAMQRQVNETRAVSDAIVEGTTELRQKVMPVFQARGRVADQLDKLATMNPLERGIRGIFDLNYDKDYLEGQLDAFDRTLKARSDDYQYLNQLHGVALQEVERRFKMDTAMSGLVAEQAKEDLGLVGMQIQQSAGMLGALSDRIGTESRMIAAKAQAREDLLLRLDTPTVTDLMTQAQEAGGIVQYNGVDFSYRELRDRVQANETQELQFESHKMAVMGGRMDLADKYATNIANSLSRTQLEAAIQNGGMYNGVQLPQDVLTNAYQNALQQSELRAQSIANRMPAQIAGQIGQDYLRQSMGLYTRGKEMMGNQAMQGMAGLLGQGTQILEQLATAINNKESPEVISALTQQLAANSKVFNEQIEQRVLRSVGGDKRAAGYMSAFMHGTELSQGTAAEAMTYFALKGNLPAGMSLTPEARQVFGKAQELVAKYRGTTVNGKAMSAEALQAAVTKDLVESAPRIMGQARHDKIFSELPSVARQTQHAFGKFDQNRWSEIRAESQLTAAEAIAHDVNTTPDNVLRMLKTGKPLSNDENGKQLFQATVQNASKFNGIESQTMVRLIDMEPAIQAGTRNSTVMNDYLGSSKFVTGLSTYGQALGAQSIGEYLTNPMVAGATERNFIETRDSMVGAQAAVHQSDRQLAQNPATNMLLKPISRTDMILSSIPGVGKPGAAKLKPFVTEFYKKFGRANGPAMETPNSRFIREDAAMLAALQATKFEDPAMESYRKQAVRSWEDHATAQQGFIERMIDGMFGDIPSIADAEVIPGVK